MAADRAVTVTAFDLLMVTAIAVESLKRLPPSEARDQLKASLDRILAAEAEGRS